MTSKLREVRLQMELKLSGCWPQSREIILHHLGGPSVSTGCIEVERKGGEQSGGDVPAGGSRRWHGVSPDSVPRLVGPWREGAVSQGMRAASSVLEKARRQTFPWTPRVNAALRAPLVQLYPHQTSNLQHKIINVSYFRPPRLVICYSWSGKRTERHVARVWLFKVL